MVEALSLSCQGVAEAPNRWDLSIVKAAWYCLCCWSVALGLAWVLRAAGSKPTPDVIAMPFSSSLTAHRLHSTAGSLWQACCMPDRKDGRPAHGWATSAHPTTSLDSLRAARRTVHISAWVQVSHEPFFCLLREVVSYGKGGKGQPSREVLDNPCADSFVLLHIE